jgi:uncharacterized MnhB-related membrane protein
MKNVEKRWKVVEVGSKSMLIVAIVVLVISLISIAMAYLAVTEKNVLYSVIYLSFLSICYSILYYIFMAPDVVLAYIPISAVLLPLITLSVSAKTSKKKVIEHEHRKD